MNECVLVCMLFDRLYIIHTSPARDFLISLWAQIDCNASAAWPAVHRCLLESSSTHIFPFLPSSSSNSSITYGLWFGPLTVLKVQKGFWKRKYLTGDGKESKHWQAIMWQYFYTSPLTPLAFSLSVACRVVSLWPLYYCQSCLSLLTTTSTSLKNTLSTHWQIKGCTHMYNHTRLYNICSN